MLTSRFCVRSPRPGNSHTVPAGSLFVPCRHRTTGDAVSAGSHFRECSFRISCSCRCPSRRYQCHLLWCRCPSCCRHDSGVIIDSAGVRIVRSAGIRIVVIIHLLAALSTVLFGYGENSRRVVAVGRNIGNCWRLPGILSHGDTCLAGCLSGKKGNHEKRIAVHR